MDSMSFCTMGSASTKSKGRLALHGSYKGGVCVSGGRGEDGGQGKPGGPVQETYSGGQTIDQGKDEDGVCGHDEMRDLSEARTPGKSSTPGIRERGRRGGEEEREERKNLYREARTRRRGE